MLWINGQFFLTFSKHFCNIVFPPFLSKPGNVISDASTLSIVIPGITSWKFGRYLLVSSHAGTRLPIADLQDSGRSPSVRHFRGFRFLLSQKDKTGDNPSWMPPVKKPWYMTSYGGIIRIRLKGRSWMTSSQPANTSSPVFSYFLLYIIHLFFGKHNPFPKELFAVF